MNGRCSCRLDCSSPGKHPLVNRGLYAATTDQLVVKEWWTRWPHANIAMAMGELVVIDIDLPRAFDSLDVLTGKLPQTLTALTGGGGVHLYFSSERELRNHAGHLPGLGDLQCIDLRATGGYVVAPPSVHVTGHRYEWLDETVAIAAAPDWLREAPRPEPAVVPPGSSSTESTRYGLVALRSERDTLLRTPVGRRNDQLNCSAFALGQLIAAGVLAEFHVRFELEKAATHIGLAKSEIQRTIASGICAGLSQPRG